MIEKKLKLMKNWGKNKKTDSTVQNLKKKKKKELKMLKFNNW